MFKKWLVNIFKNTQEDQDNPLPHISKSLYLWLGAIVFILIIAVFFISSEKTTPSAVPLRKTVIVDPPTSVVGDKELWTQRLKRQTQAAEHKAQQAENKVQTLDKQMKELQEALDQMYKKIIHTQVEPSVAEPPQIQEKQLSITSTPGFASSGTPPPIIKSSDSTEKETEKAPSIIHLSLPEISLSKSVKTYIPSGSYVRAVLTSGVVASSAIGAQSNPQPLIMRLLEGGHLPRGFKGKLKDAVLIGSCYGDLSSERAMCRLQRLSFTQKNGQVIERDVEGWVIGEDGRPGIKGVVVDRAGEVARSTIIAGLLSGVGKFFEAQSRMALPVPGVVGASVQHPQNTSFLSGSMDVLKGGAAAGTSNAFDKLAEFAIKRAESMQPVILVASGRQVDVVFKEGVRLKDIEKTHESSMKPVASFDKSYPANTFMSLR